MHRFLRLKSFDKSKMKTIIWFGLLFSNIDIININVGYILELSVDNEILIDCFLTKLELFLSSINKKFLLLKIELLNELIAFDIIIYYLPIVIAIVFMML